MVVSKKLYRVQDDKIISGLLGGLGEYFDVDPTILRLAYVLIVFLTGIIPGIVVYFIAVIVVPKKPKAKRLPTKTTKKSK